MSHYQNLQLEPEKYIHDHSNAHFLHDHLILRIAEAHRISQCGNINALF